MNILLHSSVVLLVFVLTGSDAKFWRRKPDVNQPVIRFYDLKTNETLLPPVVNQLGDETEALRQSGSGWPCSCASLMCGCCVGMTINQFNFDQHMCSNFTYDPEEFSMSMNVLMNDNSVYQNSISGKNPPPLCMPVPIPVIPISMEMCMKVFNVFTPGRNIHMCMDMIARIQKAPVMVLHFDCMRMGADGVAGVKPEDGGGLGSNVSQEGGDTPESELDAEYAAYDEVVMETRDKEKKPMVIKAAEP